MKGRCGDVPQSQEHEQRVPRALMQGDLDPRYWHQHRQQYPLGGKPSTKTIHRPGRDRVRPTESVPVQPSATKRSIHSAESEPKMKDGLLATQSPALTGPGGFIGSGGFQLKAPWSRSDIRKVKQKSGAKDLVIAERYSEGRCSAVCA
jgi:hypothetical protein